MDEGKIKKALLGRQSELRTRIGAIQADERHDVEEGLSDGAQLWQASEIRDGLDDEAAAELRQIDEALQRLDSGEYGYCSVCGGPIGEARLEALPDATLCIDDAKKAERPK